MVATLVLHDAVMTGIFYQLHLIMIESKEFKPIINTYITAYTTVSSY